MGGDTDKGGFNIPIPETSAVVAGLGGLPFTMWIVTPLRNALTLAGNNPGYTVGQCYSKAFAGGPFKGGMNMMIGAVPASIALGQLLETGQGGDVDRARARAIYRECAQRGLWEAREARPGDADYDARCGGFSEGWTSVGLTEAVGRRVACMRNFRGATPLRPQGEHTRRSRALAVSSEMTAP